MVKARISKDPEIRKNEIIAAAEELFLTKGFEETTVNDIVKKVGVAQGLFYYYFKSKDEILTAVVDRYSEYYLTELNQICKDDRLNAIQKLQTVFKTMLQIQSPEQKTVFNYVHEARNEYLHRRIEQKWTDEIISLFLTIIEQGVSEKVFEVEYPKETIEILVVGFEPYLHGALKQPDQEQSVKKIRAGLTVMEKVLGAAKGSLQIF